MRLLTFRVGARVCALPMEQVLETMRPLPIDRVATRAGVVLGLSMIRGTPTPVIDTARIFQGTEGPAEGGDAPIVHGGRFITFRVAERALALLVDEVLGARDVSDSAMRELPPLLRDARDEVIARIATLDAELLVILNGALLLPIEPPGASPASFAS